MRTCLQNTDITGATMCYCEEELCKPTLDWLCDFCDRVIILLDNFNSVTEKIVLEYKDKYPEKVHVIYSTEPVDLRRNHIDGQKKRRFKVRQPYIREQVIKKLHELNKQKPVDLFIFLDSDEVPINQFPSLLERFWNKITDRQFMQIGFIEPFESFRIILSQRMCPHGRVYRYNPQMSALPYSTRTIYRPFENGRPWKVRNVLIHMCHFNEEYRKKRQMADNIDFWERKRDVWLLPKNVQEMTVEEIAQFQPGYHGSPPQFPSIPLDELINNKDKYREYFT